MTRAPPQRRRPPPRRAYHHGDLSGALVAAAGTLLAEVGPDALSLRELARRVGVNHRAAYRHFADKRTLLAALATDAYRDLAAHLRSAVDAEPDPRARPLALGRAYVTWGVAAGPRYALMTGPRLNEDGRFPELESALADSLGLLVLSLANASGCTNGTRLRDAALGLWAAVHGVVTLVAVRRVQVRPELLPAYADTLLRPLVDGVLTALRT